MQDQHAQNPEYLYVVFNLFVADYANEHCYLKDKDNEKDYTDNNRQGRTDMRRCEVV
jgi:hypothetical protein